MKTKIDPPRECPRWAKCSVNRCPLDPFQDKCAPHPDDKEQECPLAKSIRFRIGSKYPDLLPMLGLKPREWAARERFSRLSVAQRAELAQRGRDSLAKLHRPQAGQNDTSGDKAT